jgi:hypothetical protein
MRHSPANITHRLGRWWTCDLPPLDGRLRFIVYAGLFYFGGLSFYNKIAPGIANCPPEFYQFDGVMQLFSPLLEGSPQRLASTLYALRPILVGAWILSAIGFLGRTPMMVAGLLLFYFWGALSGCTMTNHTWHLPVYTLLILGFFAHVDPKWSVDGFLAKRFKRYPFGRTEAAQGLTSSGFARKLVLVAAVYTLFAGGIMKLRESGLAWMDGESLRFYLEDFSGMRWSGWGWLYDFTLANSWVIQAMSIFTIVFELGALAAIFWPGARFPVVVMAWILHLGISRLMIPQYFPQSICYLLIVNWGLVGSGFRRRMRRSAPAPEARSCTVSPCPSRALTCAAAIGTVFAGSLCWTLVRAREWYPFTHVPMYSSYFSEKSFMGYPKDELSHLETWREISRRWIKTDRPWYFKFAMSEYLHFALENSMSDAASTPEFLVLEDKQLASNNRGTTLAGTERRAVHDVAEQLAHGEDGFEKEPGDDAPATEFLRAMLPLARNIPESKHYSHLSLQFMLNGEYHRLARIPLRPES